MSKPRTYSEVLSLGQPSKVSSDLWLLIICILSVIWIFCYKIIFINIDEAFHGASVIGEILFNLLASVIASGIFYYIVVYREKNRTKKIVYPLIRERLLTIGATAPSIIRALSKVSNSGDWSLPDEEVFAKVYGNILLHEKPPTDISQSYSYETWRDFFQDQLNSIHFHSELLYKYSAFLSPELLLKLSNIQYSNFEKSLANTKGYHGFSVGDTSNGLWEFLKELQEIASADF